MEILIYKNVEFRRYLNTNIYSNEKGDIISSNFKRTEKIGFFNSDYMLTFVIHYYGILAAVLAIAVIGAVLIWFLQKTGHQKNQLGMIMGTGCVVVLFTQFIGYVVENLGCFPLSNNYCPFLTVGGSGIMISYIMFGILLSIYRYQNVLVETEVKKKIGI